MKRATTGISLALALSAGLIGASMSPALADGDPYYSNGINPSGVRTPVPAPIPYPVEEADWYFRGDFAAGFGSRPSVNVLGTNLVESVFGPVGQSESFEPSFTGGVGVGYIWGPHIRTDLTVDVHSIMNTEQNGSGTIPVPTSIDGQDEVHVDHPAGQRLLRHPHRLAVDAVPRRRCRLCRQSADAQAHLYRQRVGDNRHRQAIAPPMCSLPPPPWSACPTISPRSSPST